MVSDKYQRVARVIRTGQTDKALVQMAQKQRLVFRVQFADLVQTQVRAGIRLLGPQKTVAKSFFRDRAAVLLW